MRSPASRPWQLPSATQRGTWPPAFRGEFTDAQRWSEAEDWTILASSFDAGCDANLGGAFDISDDGGVVVGLMWDGCRPAAFRWTAAEGVVPLDVLGEGSEGSSTSQSNRATVVSGDGLVSAGFAALSTLDRSPARWSADGSGQLLDPDNSESPGEVLSIDRTGGTLAGDPVYPLAMSDEGAVVLGGVGSEFFTTPIAFVWDAEHGMRSLQPLVEAAGIAIEDGWLLTRVVAVSDDLQVIVGRGFDADYQTQTFVLRLDPEAAGIR